MTAKHKPSLSELWFSPLGHLNSQQKSLNRAMINSWLNSWRTTEVVCQPGTNLHDISKDLIDFQIAIVGRMGMQQKALLEGLGQIQQEYYEYQDANTISKMADNSNNIVGQITSLAQNQTAGWAQLLDNIQVDYSYWLHLKGEQAKACSCENHHTSGS